MFFLAGLTWTALGTVTPEGGGGGGAPGTQGVGGALATSGEHTLLPSSGEAGGGRRRCRGAAGGAVAPPLGGRGGGGGGAPGPQGVGGAHGSSREHTLLPSNSQAAWTGRVGTATGVLILV